MKKDEKREAKSHRKASERDAGGVPKMMVFPDPCRVRERVAGNGPGGQRRQLYGKRLSS